MVIKAEQTQIVAKQEFINIKPDMSLMLSAKVQRSDNQSMIG
jgi:hypothetical protein